MATKAIITSTATTNTTAKSKDIVAYVEIGQHNDDDDHYEFEDDVSSVTICNTESMQHRQTEEISAIPAVIPIVKQQFNQQTITSPDGIIDSNTNSDKAITSVNISPQTTSTANQKTVYYKHNNDQHVHKLANVHIDKDDIIKYFNCNSSNTTTAAPQFSNAEKHCSTISMIRYKQQIQTITDTVPIPLSSITLCAVTSPNENLLLCRRFKDLGDTLCNFNSLPLFIYATSPTTHAVSADGVGVAQVAVKAAKEAANNYKNNHPTSLLQSMKYSENTTNGSSLVKSPMDCFPLTVVSGGSYYPYAMASNNAVNVTVATTALTPNYGPHQSHNLNVDHNAHILHHHLNHTSHAGGQYINSYALHHAVGGGSSHHHHVHSEQTKSLQELQHEVGALLEFRDLVIETFPDLKQKMASMSSAASSSNSHTVGVNTIGNGISGNIGQSVGSVISAAGSTVTLTSNSTLVSRREWEPGIRTKRKVTSQKEQTNQQPATTTELSSSSLTERSRSNSQSGKKEPKNNASQTNGNSTGVTSGVNGTSGGSGGVGAEHNNGSVIQDSGFSTETTSSKEGHSASSTNGALTGAMALNRLSCLDTDDELLNLLDVIHRKSNRLREEVEHLQNYERQQYQQNSTHSTNSAERLDTAERDGAMALSKSSSTSSANTALTPKTFREHVERLNKEDVKQLRKERDRLLDKLAEMEAETLTGRIKATKISEQVEELINVKKELEEQLKLAMAQKLELSSRMQQLQQQQFNKVPNSQPVNISSQRCLLNSTSNTTIETAIDALGSQSSSSSSSQIISLMRLKHDTFQPIINENQQQQQSTAQIFPSNLGNSQNYHHHQSQQQQQLFATHQSNGSDTKRNQQQEQKQQQHQCQFTVEQLGRLDGIISNPGLPNSKGRLVDSKRFAAILLENNVIELQRQLLTLTVQNQVLMKNLDQANKSKSHLVKNLEKSKEDIEDLRFQLEEKDIELEGTKAQLRILETQKLQSSTPLSDQIMMPSDNSYLLHSHQDYETNRSSNSTTLMMSRREGVCNSGNEYKRAATPIKHLGYLPQPTTTQISTPSMKAMTHLPMDELQQNNSSTESAHDSNEHQEQQRQMQKPTSAIKSHHKNPENIMSISVGGTSPFDEQQQQQQQINALRNQVQALKKFSGITTKPSKIPLPGSKAAAYFAGKPPTGKLSTIGRSPPSGNNSSGSVNRSPLSRSTGNLIYTKSPNSLKRADSILSVRKDNSSSLSTTSRSSTSSSIPLPTTPYLSSTPKTINATLFNNNINNNNNSNNNCNNSPSPKVLQNSPLPKLKRESLSARVRQMDSLSRAYNNTQHQHQQQQQKKLKQNFVSNNTSNTSSNNSSNYMATNTAGKAATLNSIQRKDVHLNSSNSFSHGTTNVYTRRSTTNKSSTSAATTISTTAATTARRFSSASVVGPRVAAAARQMESESQQYNNNVSGSSGSAPITVTSTTSNNSNNCGGSSVNSGGGGGDNDSGKVRTFKSTVLGWLKL